MNYMCVEIGLLGRIMNLVGNLSCYFNKPVQKDCFTGKEEEFRDPEKDKENKSCYHSDNWQEHTAAELW